MRAISRLPTGLKNPTVQTSQTVFSDRGTRSRMRDTDSGSVLRRTRILALRNTPRPRTNSSGDFVSAGREREGERKKDPISSFGMLTMLTKIQCDVRGGAASFTSAITITIQLRHTPPRYRVFTIYTLSPLLQTPYHQLARY